MQTDKAAASIFKGLRVQDRVTVHVKGETLTATKANGTITVIGGNSGAVTVPNARSTYDVRRALEGKGQQAASETIDKPPLIDYKLKLEDLIFGKNIGKPGNLLSLIIQQPPNNESKYIIPRDYGSRHINDNVFPPQNSPVMKFGNRIHVFSGAGTIQVTDVKSEGDNLRVNLTVNEDQISPIVISPEDKGIYLYGRVTLTPDHRGVIEAYGQRYGRKPSEFLKVEQTSIGSEYGLGSGFEIQPHLGQSSFEEPPIRLINLLGTSSSNFPGKFDPSALFGNFSIGSLARNPVRKSDQNHIVVADHVEITAVRADGEVLYVAMNVDGTPHDLTIKKDENLLMTVLDLKVNDEDRAEIDRFATVNGREPKDFFLCIELGDMFSLEPRSDLIGQYYLEEPQIPGARKFGPKYPNDTYLGDSYFTEDQLPLHKQTPNEPPASNLNLLIEKYLTSLPNENQLRNESLATTVSDETLPAPSGPSPKFTAEINHPSFPSGLASLDASQI